MVSFFLWTLPVKSSAPTVSFLPLQGDLTVLVPHNNFKTEVDYTLEKIAWCESRGDLSARNPNSSAKGKYQFLDGTWEHYGKEYWGSTWNTHDVFSEKDQDDLAYFVVSLN